jgi:hypothetical protein
MILHAAILLVLSMAAADKPGGAQAGDDEAMLLGLVNGERGSLHLAPLRWDADLARLARLHAADMRAAGRISHHSTADGADFSGRLARTAYRASAAAENVALDSDVAHAHRGLMNSPGHRANILNPELTAIGIGIVKSPDGAMYLVEDFATSLARITDEEAAARVRAAVATARRRAKSAPLEEDREVSGRLAAVVDRLAAADSVHADTAGGFSEGWVFTYTSMDPSTLPRDAASKVAKARGYALAVSFRKSRSYPFGTWWIVLALNGAG